MAFLYNAEVKFFLYLKQKSADPFFSLSFPAGHVFEFLTCFYFGNVSAFTVSVNPGASICPVIFILFKKIWYYNLSRDEVAQRKLSNVIIEILLRSDCTPVRLCFSLSLALSGCQLALLPVPLSHSQQRTFNFINKTSLKTARSDRMRPLLSSCN